MDNYQAIQDETIRLQAPLQDRIVTGEVSGDFTLHDYQPPIKRLLRVEATMTPANLYVGGGSAEFSGNVDFCVLYAGEDGCLYSVTRSEEYNLSSPIEMTADFDSGEGILCRLDGRCENVSGRVAAPRRLSLKCKLAGRVRMYGTRLYPMSTQGEGDRSSLCRLFGSASSAWRYRAASDPLTLADEIATDSSMGEVRVISADGRVQVNEATSGSNTVHCTGQILLKLLCAKEGDGEDKREPRVLSAKLPFAAEVPVDGVGVDCMATAYGDCTGIEVTVEEGRILCEVGVVLTACAERNRDLTYVRDLYSTAGETTTVSEPCTLRKTLSAVSGNVSFSERVPLAEHDITSDRVPLDVWATALPGEVEWERGRARLTGKCRCHVLLGGEEEFAAREVEVPFRYECECPEAVADWDANVTVLSCRARMSGDSLTLDGELAVSMILRAEQGIALMRELRFGDIEEDSGGQITFCYPASDDTLWSVAKRYHTTVEKLAARNRLPAAPASDSPESLGGASYLIV